MKPHYRLHVNLGDAKPLWWVSSIKRVRSMSMRVTTHGYSTSRRACQAALRL